MSLDSQDVLRALERLERSVVELRRAVEDLVAASKHLVEQPRYGPSPLEKLLPIQQTMRTVQFYDEPLHPRRHEGAFRRVVGADPAPKMEK